jgi:tRNA threonylcarbamoyladenosine biosynthesis protein TsaE
MYAFTYLCAMDRIYDINQVGEIAADLVTQFGSKPVWAFFAPMGAGKTTLIAAIGKQMGIVDTISSPTFALMNAYDAKGKMVYHMDWYRLDSEKEAARAGMEAAFDEADICFVEWPDKAMGLLPVDTQHFEIEILDPEHRRIFIPS